MKGLFNRQLQQGLIRDLALLGIVNPELAALARMFSDGAAILTGDGDFHVEGSLRILAKHLAPNGALNLDKLLFLKI